MPLAYKNRPYSGTCDNSEEPSSYLYYDPCLLLSIPDDWRGQDCANIWISTGAWNDRDCETDTYYDIIEFD